MSQCASVRHDMRCCESRRRLKVCVRSLFTVCDKHASSRCHGASRHVTVRHTQSVRVRHGASRCVTVSHGRRRRHGGGGGGGLAAARGVLFGAAWRRRACLLPAGCIVPALPDPRREEEVGAAPGHHSMTSARAVVSSAVSFRRNSCGQRLAWAGGLIKEIGAQPAAGRDVNRYSLTSIWIFTKLA